MEVERQAEACLKAERFAIDFHVPAIDAAGGGEAAGEAADEGLLMQTDAETRAESELLEIVSPGFRAAANTARKGG